MRGIVFLGIIVMMSLTVKAQYSELQGNRMKKAVEDCINSYSTLLGVILDNSSGSFAERNEDLKNTYGDYFFNKEIDYYCGSCSDKKIMPAFLFHVNLMSNYQLLDDNAKVVLNYDKELMDFFTSGDKKEKKTAYVNLPVTIKWNLKSQNSNEKLKPESLNFTFIINTSTNEYVARIYQVSKEKIKNQNDQTIQFTKDTNELSSDVIKIKEYYQDRLIQSDYYLKRNKWIEAYWCAEEANRGANLLGKKASEIARIKREVRIGMRGSANEMKDEDLEDDIKNGLIKLGKQLLKKGEWDQAYSCFSKATSVGNSEIKKTELEALLQTTNEQLKKQQNVDNLIRDSKFNLAAEEMNKLILASPDNTTYISKLALIYGLNRQPDKVNASLQKAKSIDDKNPRIYENQMEWMYFEQDFKAFGDIYKLYTLYVDFSDPNLRKYQAMNAYAEAWKFKQRQNNLVALDSINSSITTYPYAANAYVLKSDLISDSKEAMKILEEGERMIKPMNDLKEYIKIVNAKRADRFGNSRASVMDLINVDKTNVDAFFQIGTEKYKEALSAFKKGENKNLKPLQDTAIKYLELARQNIRDNPSVDKNTERLCIQRLIKSYIFRNDPGDVKLAIGILEEKVGSEPRAAKDAYLQDAVYAYLIDGNLTLASRYIGKLSLNGINNLLKFYMDLENGLGVTQSEEDLKKIFIESTIPESSFFSTERIEHDLRQLGKEQILSDKKVTRALKAAKVN